MGSFVVNSTSNKRFDLSWGNAVCVRQAFIEGLFHKVVFFGLTDDNLNYTPHDGDEKLIEITRSVIERQVGPTYQHIFLVNGATGGVTLALRAYVQMGYKTALTRKAPYFPIYPDMVESAGLKHVYGQSYKNCANPVALIDSPSNPAGDIEEGTPWTGTPLIWDAVYHNRVYTAGNYKPIGCDVMVGSYSKLLGLNGIRMGWIATNDNVVAMHLKSLITAEYCGLSSAGNVVMLNVLEKWKEQSFWENFEWKARANLNVNREEWSKLERYFAGQRVSPNGMFFFGPADEACKKLLQKSGIVYTKGPSMGVSDDYIRINLGQDTKLVREAVQAVIKNDHFIPLKG